MTNKNKPLFIDSELGVEIVRARLQYFIMHRNATRQIKNVRQGVERHLRLDLRVMLNNGDHESFEKTNAIADDLAMHILKNFDVREKGDHGTVSDD